MYFKCETASLFIGLTAGLIVAPLFYLTLYWLAKKAGIVGFQPTAGLEVAQEYNDGGVAEFSDSWPDADVWEDAENYDANYWRTGRKKYGDEQI